jgi:trimeric autotransporter adhesin
MKHLNFCLTAILFFLFFSSTNSFSQVAINSNGAMPNSSAMLDIQSTTKGLLIPTMTLTQRNSISSPATGLLIFQTDNTPGFYFYTGSAWSLVSSVGTVSGSGTNGYITFWNGSNSVTGSTNLFWDATNNRLGINTSYPLAPLQVHGRVYQAGLGWSTFFGFEAGMSDDGTDNYNSAFGFRSLYLNTNGSSNVSVGTESLYSNTLGSWNIAVGSTSLRYNSTGFLNTAVGHSAGLNTSSGHNQTSNTSVYIGAQADALNDGDENEIVIGFGADGVGSNSVVLGNTGISKTVLRGSVGLGTESPNSNAILDIQSLSKGLLIPRMTEAQRNAILSPTAGLLVYQHNNTRGFYFYDNIPWPPCWVLLGGSSVSGSGTSGYVTFWNGTNSVTGNSNLYWDNTNSRLGINTSSPGAPLQVNGRVYQDGLNFSTFFGYSAGANQDGSGDRNVAVGYTSLPNLTSGDHNTALGTDAGTNLTTGTNSVFLGSQAKPSSSGNTNEIVIGYGTTGLGTNTAVLGNGDITKTVLRGNVGIGTTNPTDKLEVYNGTSTGKYTTSGWTHSSDIRLKYDVENMEGTLEKILKLRGVTFKFNNDSTNKIQIGFIAQELEKEFPEFIVTGTDGYKSVAYANMTAVLVEGMKEQQSKINDLEDRITKLENKNQVADNAGFAGNPMLWVFLSACVITAGIIRFKKNK